MKRSEYPSDHPINSGNVGISTLAYMKQTLDAIDRRQQGSRAWKAAMNELKYTLIQQIACICSDEMLQELGASLTQQRRELLWDMVSEPYAKAIAHIRGSIMSAQYITGETLRMLESYWQVRRLAVPLGWTHVHEEPDLMTEELEAKIQYLIEKESNSAVTRIATQEITARYGRRNHIPDAMWWWYLTAEGEDRTNEDDRDKFGRRYTLPPINGVRHGVVVE